MDTNAKLELSVKYTDGENEDSFRASITERAHDNAHSDLVTRLEKMITKMRTNPILITDLVLSVDKEISFDMIGDRYQTIFDKLVGGNTIPHISVIDRITINAPGAVPEPPPNQEQPREIYTDHDSLLLGFFGPFFISLNAYPMEMTIVKEVGRRIVKVWPEPSAYDDCITGREHNAIVSAIRLIDDSVGLEKVRKGIIPVKGLTTRHELDIENRDETIQDMIKMVRYYTTESDEEPGLPPTQPDDPGFPPTQPDWE